MMTFLGAPVLIGPQPLGDVHLTEKAGGERFSERDEEAVQPLAGFTGVAIDHARGRRA